MEKARIEYKETGDKKKKKKKLNRLKEVKEEGGMRMEKWLVNRWRIL